MKTQITWTKGSKEFTHSFGRKVTLSFARDCFRRSVIESQGVILRDSPRIENIKFLNTISGA